MRITLTVTAGPHQGRVFTFVGHDTFLVGRSKRAHFQLPAKDRYFSRIHFLVEVNPPQCGLMDMGSRNGTYVNERRVERCPLGDGDRIRAGHTILRVSVEDVPAAVPPAVPSVPAPQPITISALKPPFLPVSVALPAAACRVCAGPLATVPVSVGPGLPAVCQQCLEQIRAQPQPIPGYHVVRELGRGAMGRVYLALDEAGGPPVALKTVTPAVAASGVQMERFLREARILRELDHPHIVAFRDMGEADGLIYFAMDYVRGSDAAKLLAQQGPFAVGRAVSLACQVLDALAYAHANRFVHRDIKPSNLLVTEEEGRERVLVADFGLARVYQSSQLSGLTMTGEIGGTVAFMPPEQITEYRNAAPPADQYSTAATLYNLLTGAYVCDLPADLTGQLLMILHDEPVPIRARRRDVPQGLAEAIHRALARDPQDRWPDVTALQTALRPFQA